MLAQRIKGELPHTARRLADELALRPMDPQAWSWLFDALLGLRALDQSDDTGTRDAREKDVEEARTRAYDVMKERSADMPAPPPAMTAPSAPMPSSGADGFAARYRRSRRGTTQRTSDENEDNRRRGSQWPTGEKRRRGGESA